jgi:hypothetical protein
MKKKDIEVADVTEAVLHGVPRLHHTKVKELPV